MYGKPGMACFIYQVYLYGSEAITYLSTILWAVTEPALWVLSVYAVMVFKVFQKLSTTLYYY